MDNCFSHFIYGKIIRDGIDHSGFSVVAKSKDVEDATIQTILPQISVGQILTWDNFVEVFTLAQDSVKGYRAFAYSFKSKEMDLRRGYFPVQHCLLIEDKFPQNLVNLANEFAFASGNYNYAFPESIIVNSLCLNPKSEFDKFSWDILSTNKQIILQILDSLFYSKPVVAITKENNPLFRLAIANAVWLLLPKALQKQFSFHTNFFGSPDKISSLLKFTESVNFDSGNHTVLDLRRGDEALSSLRDVRSDYVKYVSHLLADGVISPEELSTYCADLGVEREQFTLPYAKAAGEALKDKIEIPMFLSRIRQRPPDLALGEVLDFFQRPQVYSNNETVKLIWIYVCESNERSLINKFITSNFQFAENVLIDDNDNLVVSWLNYLIINKDKESLDIYLNEPVFLSKYPDLTPFIFSILVKIGEDFNEKQVELLLESGIKSNNPNQYVNIVLSGGIGAAKRKFPATFDFLEIIGGRQTKLKSRGNIIDKLVQEIGIDNLIRLNVLSLRIGNFELLNADFFSILPKSSLPSLFFSYFEKINIESLLKLDISLNDFGALGGATTVYSIGLLRKVVPIKRLNGNFDNFYEYATGFVKFADNSKSPVAVYTHFVDSLYDLSSLDHAYLYIALAELTDNFESGKYLLNHVTQFFNYSVEDSRWTRVGESLLELLSVKYKTIGDVFIQNITIAYIKTLGKLEPENSYAIAGKLLSYAISPRIIIESIVRTISLSSYMFQQKLNILFSLAVNCYPAEGNMGEVGKQALLQLVNSTLISGVTHEQFEDIEDLVANDDPIRLTVRDERWKRTLKESLAEFVRLVSLECQNKTERELEEIATIIARIWHPQNTYELQTMLTLLQQENKTLWGKVWAMLLSGKIETSFDVRVELTNDELIRLEKEIKRVERLILWLSNGRLDTTANKSLVKEMLSNLTLLDKALEQLQSKLKPSLWSRLVSRIQK